MISCTHRMTNHSSTRNYIELKIFKPGKEKTIQNIYIYLFIYFCPRGKVTDSGKSQGNF
jgi:hypothetical protein